MKTLPLMLVALLVCAHGAAADTQFVLVGPIEHFEIDGPANDGGNPPVVDNDPNSPANRLRGGHMTVHGVSVLLPRNLLVQLPGRLMTTAQLFEERPGADPNAFDNVSGLALDDAPPPLAAFEAEIVGNYITDPTDPTKIMPVAGLVKISQHSLATGAGFVTAIDHGTGVLTIGTARVRLADPSGRFGLPQQGSAQFPFDDRFSVDDENATVHAITGYPMCVRRQPPDDPATELELDPECPMNNRMVDGVKLNTLVMDDQGLPPIPADSRPVPACPLCDPEKQAPILVGDFVTYSGTVQADAAGRFIWAHTLVPEVGLYTEPGGEIAYMVIEEGLVGSADGRPTILSDGSALAIEGNDGLRIEGFRTDPTSNVRFYAIDLAADGTRSFHLIAEQDDKRDGVRGRFRRTIGKNAPVFADKDDNIKGLTREFLAVLDNRSRNDPAIETPPAPFGEIVANEIVPNRYTSPWSEIIFPENRVPGDRQPPANFECLAFLLQGGETIDGGSMTGQLAPWPATAPPPANVGCIPAHFPPS